MLPINQQKVNSVSILNKLKLKLLISGIKELISNFFCITFFLWWVCRFILHDTDILTAKKKLRTNKWQLTKYNKIQRIIMDDFRNIEEGSQLTATQWKHRLIYYSGCNHRYRAMLLFNSWIKFFFFSLPNCYPA